MSLISSSLSSESDSFSKASPLTSSAQQAHPFAPEKQAFLVM